MACVIVALDPGLAHPAVAIGVDGRLVHASRVRLPSHLAEIEETGERADQIACVVLEYLRAWPFPSELVYEKMQVYDARKGKSKGDANVSLIPLVMVGASLSGMLRVTARSLGAPFGTVTPEPARWLGGSYPKSKIVSEIWTSPRGRRVAARLDDAERASIVDSHDAVDAVGMLLWRMGRFGRKRSYAK